MHTLQNAVSEPCKKKKTCASLNYNFMVFIEALHNSTHVVLCYCVTSYRIIVAWHTPYRPVNLCRRPTCHCGQWFQSFDNQMVIALPRLDLAQRLLLVCHARWRDSNLKKHKLKRRSVARLGECSSTLLTQPLDGMLVQCNRHCQNIVISSLLS